MGQSIPRGLKEMEAELCPDCVNLAMPPRVYFGRVFFGLGELCFGREYVGRVDGLSVLLCVCRGARAEEQDGGAGVRRQGRPGQGAVRQALRLDRPPDQPQAQARQIAQVGLRAADRAVARQIAQVGLRAADRAVARQIAQVGLRAADRAVARQIAQVGLRAADRAVARQIAQVGLHAADRAVSPTRFFFPVASHVITLITLTSR